MKKALVFVSRCQNLESEYNTTQFAAKNPDGGFYYTPAAGGSSMAGKTADGGLMALRLNPFEAARIHAEASKNQTRAH